MPSCDNPPFGRYIVGYNKDEGINVTLRECDRTF